MQTTIKMLRTRRTIGGAQKIRQNLLLELTLEHVYTWLHANKWGVKIELGSGKKREWTLDYSGIQQQAFLDSELTEYTANMWAGYFGSFLPPTPSNHTPTSLATSRRAVSPSIVPFSHSLTPPASSVDFLPAVTVYSSLSCFSTSVPRQAEYVSAVYQIDQGQH